MNFLDIMSSEDRERIAYFQQILQYFINTSENKGDIHHPGCENFCACLACKNFVSELAIKLFKGLSPKIGNFFSNQLLKKSIIAGLENITKSYFTEEMEQSLENTQSQ